MKKPNVTDNSPMKLDNEVNENAAILLNHVSKAFPLGVNKSSTLRQESLSIIKQMLNPQKRYEKKYRFWALRNVSFTVNRGEAVAIIGHNGSGKTTLLRLMANIMRPTSGTVEVNGKYGALIGLGTGFRPWLTGLQNIYLSCAIYGLRKNETEHILNDIIAFADIGDFINSPVKTYSSGMKARLGFSVILHMLPEIFFIDEIIAVGDASFRQKGFDRILQMRSENRTFILVSHSPGIIRQLCERIIWLHRGEIRDDGPVEKILLQYQMFMQ